MSARDFVVKISRDIDWILVSFVAPIVLAGLFTMRSFVPDDGGGNFFDRQIIWVLISFAIFLILSFMDLRFLKRTDVLVFLFLALCSLLFLLFVIGNVSRGAQSWFNFGGFSFQPVELMKIFLILLLAKYFSRRHVEIKDIKHIFISGLYALIPFILVFLQPDFGSAMIIFLIWFGMVLVSGISKKHLLMVFLSGTAILICLWFFAFAPHQKERIVSFLNPLADVQGAGYHAYQSTIAVGSGGITGKGLGFGTQSRLKFLPEPEADFIFSAFAEEWGFIGSVLLLLLFTLIVSRVLHFASFGASNFEILFGMGFAIYIMSHMFINVGMNLGLLPVTGTPLPFMSYGGSHLMADFIGLGIFMSMRKYSRAAHRDDINNEFLGM